MANRKTIIKSIAAIKTIYNYFGKDTDLELLVDTWTALLENYTDEDVSKGIFLAMRVCKFAPTPADVIEQIENFRQIEKPCEAELWAAYRKALTEVGYNLNRINYNYIDSTGVSQGEQARRAIEKIWNELPQELQIYLANKDELIRMAREYNLSDFSFERNRFSKTLPVLQKRVEDKKLLLAIGNKASGFHLTNAGRDGKIVP